MSDDPKPHDLAFVGEAVQEGIEILYGKKMGFALIVFPFNNIGTGDYVSNCVREDVIKAIRECANHLENEEDFQVYTKTIGNA